MLFRSVYFSGTQFGQRAHASGFAKTTTVLKDSGQTMLVLEDSGQTTLVLGDSGQTTLVLEDSG